MGWAEVVATLVSACVASGVAAHAFTGKRLQGALRQVLQEVLVPHVQRLDALEKEVASGRREREVLHSLLVQQGVVVPLEARRVG
jgi:hypothetical protein